MNRKSTFFGNGRRIEKKIGLTMLGLFRQTIAGKIHNSSMEAGSMVEGRRQVCNSESRFAPPPWDEDSPERLAIAQQLSAGDLVWGIEAAVEELDLTPLYETYAGVGSKAHSPKLMLRMALYAIHKGWQRASEWFDHSRDSLAMRYLGCGIRPCRSCWYEFHDRLGRVQDQLNQQVLGEAVDAEATSAERGALDGSSIAANASRRQLLDGKRLKKRQDQLAAARELDDQGETPEEIPRWMAKTPATRKAQQTQFQQAQECLREREEENERRIPSERKKKIVISTSDPAAAPGLDKEHVFRPLYTAQVVRDLDSQLILGYDVYPQSTDANTLTPMMERVFWLTGRKLKVLLVDSGYVTGWDLAVCDGWGIRLYGPWKENDYSGAKETPLFSKDQFEWLPELQTYRCPAGNVLKRVGTEKRTRSGGRSEISIKYVCPREICEGCPLREQCTTSRKSGRSVKRSEHEELIVAHREKMETEQAKALYKLRGQSVELVYADFKEHRALRRFSRRGLHRARTQFGLCVLAHNMLVLRRLLNAGETECEKNATPEKIAA